MGSVQKALSNYREIGVDAVNYRSFGCSVFNKCWAGSILPRQNSTFSECRMTSFFRLGLFALLFLPAFTTTSSEEALASSGHWEPERGAMDATARDYNFSSLRLLDRVRYFVEDKYVDPQRIDPGAMFDAALAVVERNNAGVLFSREPQGKLLHVAVDTFSTTLELPPIDRLNIMSTQLSRVAEILDVHLPADVKRSELEYGFINGMLSTLDPHSVLLPPEVSKEWEVENQGEFGGLGITIQMREGWLTVQYPLKETPAFRAGIKAEDRITRIEDESTINMDLKEAVSKLRGPVGAPVNITVDRESFSTPRVFTIVRDRIRINPVEGMLLEGGVGYVQIDNFHAAASRDLAMLLAQFKRENQGRIKGLVLDLRGNPGGYLHQAIEISDMFLSDGAIVSTVEGGRRDLTEAHSGGTESDYPITILVNASSASASEIVAGALKNRQRAVIIGERTFGKGSVQHVYPNGDDSRLKMTVSKYLTPGDQSIQGVGVSPDILLQPSVVEMVVNEEKGTEDPLVALNWRSRVSREADLDQAFDWGTVSIDPAVYEVRYLRVNTERDGPRTDDVDVSNDWEVQFAKDLILSVSNSRRADMLVVASQVVERANKAEAAHIHAAFADLGIDWTSGKQPLSPPLTLNLVVDGGKIVSGLEAQEVTVTVTNTGAETVHQVMAVASSELGFMEGEEFFFGLLKTGESRSWSKTLRGIDGQTERLSEVVFALQDAAGNDFGEHKERVGIEGAPVPAFAFEVLSRDSGKECDGNGNGLADRDETVCLDITVTNVGKGDAPEVFAKLRNRAGHDLDLVVGTAELGPIKAGAQASATLVFELRGKKELLPVELSVGDNQRYDYNGVMRGGFYDYFVQMKAFDIGLGQAVSFKAEPPKLSITRQPDGLVGQSQVVLSGLVEDDNALQDLLIYHGKDKVFYQGGGDGLKTLPFSVDLELDAGENLVVLLARDVDGLTDIRSVNLFYDPQVPEQE
jgi:carboxyl-terminal processing protease